MKKTASEEWKLFGSTVVDLWNHFLLLITQRAYYNLPKMKRCRILQSLITNRNVHNMLNRLHNVQEKVECWINIQSVDINTKDSDDE